MGILAAAVLRATWGPPPWLQAHCQTHPPPPFPPAAPAGISRDSLHKRRATGGRKKTWRKKKK
jgi:hypothetical protein